MVAISSTFFLKVVGISSTLQPMFEGGGGGGVELFCGGLIIIKTTAAIVVVNLSITQDPLFVLVK